MRAALTKTEQTQLYHLVSGEEVHGPNPKMTGNCSGLTGNCTGLTGYCTGLFGDSPPEGFTGIHSDVERAYFIPGESGTSIDVWQKYASPVWDDINQTNTLNFREGRHSDDERHICPLQLDVIERCLQLWSLPGDVVFTPFLGIGSEAYVSVKMGRMAIGSELKPSYFDLAVRNMKSAEIKNYDLFL